MPGLEIHPGPTVTVTIQSSLTSTVNSFLPTGTTLFTGIGYNRPAHTSVIAGDFKLSSASGLPGQARAPGSV